MSTQAGKIQALPPQPKAGLLATSRSAMNDRVKLATATPITSSRAAPSPVRRWDGRFDHIGNSYGRWLDVAAARIPISSGTAHSHRVRLAARAGWASGPNGLQTGSVVRSIGVPSRLLAGARPGSRAGMAPPRGLGAVSGGTGRAAPHRS